MTAMTSKMLACAGLAASVAVCAALGPPHPPASTKEEMTREEAVFVLRAWYAGVSALEHNVEYEHTAPPLTLELDPATRIVIPPHLEEQEVVEVQRMDLGPGLDDAVVIGINARTAKIIHQSYALVYARKDGQMVLHTELPLRERFERIEQAWVNRHEPVLVLNGFSGNHFMDLFVFRFVGGVPELLFANGSAAGAEFRYDITTPVPTIWIAVEDWSDPDWNFAGSDRRWNVFTWDGDEFIYNEQLSSARELSVEERLSHYTMRTLKRIDEFKKDPRWRERLSQSRWRK